MSAMDLDNDVSTLLATIRLESESSELIHILYQLEDFYERKLWHQLTLSLDEFYYSTANITPELKFKIYNLFINQFSSKLNAIKVVDFLLESFNGQVQDTLDKLLELREQFVEDIKKEHNIKTEDEKDYKNLVENDESVVYINLQISRHYILLNELIKAEEILDKLSDKFDSSSNQNFDSQELTLLTT